MSHVYAHTIIDTLIHNYTQLYTIILHIHTYTHILIRRLYIRYIQYVFVLGQTQGIGHMGELVPQDSSGVGVGSGVGGSGGGGGGGGGSGGSSSSGGSGGDSGSSSSGGRGGDSGSSSGSSGSSSSSSSGSSGLTLLASECSGEFDAGELGQALQLAGLAAASLGSSMKQCIGAKLGH
jgi:hypothetical protein